MHLINRSAVCGLALISALMGAGGCSDSAVLPPSPLPDFETSLQLEKLWDYDIGSGVDDQFLSLHPAVGEQSVYVASLSGELAKLERSSGDEVWQVDTEDKITGGVDAGYGVVAYGTAEGYAVARNEKDGSAKWRTKLSGQVLAKPAIGSTFIVFQTYDGSLYALNREDGKQAWVFDTQTPVLTLRGTSNPYQSGPIVLAGFANGKMVALESRSGIVGWQRKVSQAKGRSELEKLNDIDGQFWVTSDTVYVVNYQGNLSALDLRTGQSNWSQPYSSNVGVAANYGQVFAINEDSVINAFNSDDGEQQWQQELLKGRKLTSPTAFDDYVIAGDFEGYLHWLNAKNGDFLARVKLDSDGVRAAPVVVDDVLYAQGNSGEIAAYRVVEK